MTGRYIVRTQDGYFNVTDTCNNVPIVNGIRTEIEAEWLADHINRLNDEKDIITDDYTDLQEKYDENEEYNKKAIQKLTVQKLEIKKWINDKISDLEKKYEFGQTEYNGCPMHNIQFGINILKELQEYWEEQKND